MAVSPEFDQALKKELDCEYKDMIYCIIDRCLDELRAEDGNIHNERVKLIIDMMMPDEVI